MLEEGHEVESFELAATMEKLARRGCCYTRPGLPSGQHHDQRSRLDHGVQEQLALMEVEALAAK